MPPKSSGDLDFSGRGSNKNTGAKKGKGCIIALVILLILGAIAVAGIVVLVFDVGGIRERYVMRYIRNAPLIGSMFPPAEEEDASEEMTPDEMRVLINNNRVQIASLESQRDALNAQLASANSRIEHLSRFEARWQQYRETSALFTQMLAHNDPNNFVTFFEAIVDHDLVPQDILARAYAEAEAIRIFIENNRVLVSTYNNMETKRAAENLERLLLAEQELAIMLVRSMGAARRAEIFDEMDQIVSTNFTILLSYEAPTFSPLVPAPELPNIATLPSPTATPTPIPFEEEPEEEPEEPSDE
ncbi:MAG: hypothetical protein LBI27_09700 [Clostridiales bacterium]|jgi:hypothetical protein|nr:hypothetical protein [Clostridiales bacterium]